ncbi:hypothetical protein CPJCM30710_00460 [Clostridium polyendosporum]|uniref:Uncharacterized protein n=1 Tax=Clostridium polyendosporum TaxID=69208 RepID=A0A919RVR4_9CLOT|nr:hypothetical protein [Clostridium polyendosporum]GIM27380.1 hypothetical protein CPJCM30710_00460 [Clostridium polyendosporum]
MKIAIITNVKVPYRNLQIEEFAKIENTEFAAYYTHKDVIGR